MLLNRSYEFDSSFMNVCCTIQSLTHQHPNRNVITVLSLATHTHTHTFTFQSNRARIKANFLSRHRHLNKNHIQIFAAPWHSCFIYQNKSQPLPCFLSLPDKQAPFPPAGTVSQPSVIFKAMHWGVLVAQIQVVYPGCPLCLNLEQDLCHMSVCFFSVILFHLSPADDHKKNNLQWRYSWGVQTHQERRRWELSTCSTLVFAFDLIFRVCFIILLLVRRSLLSILCIQHTFTLMNPHSDVA